jgi:hypothetical protein
MALVVSKWVPGRYYIQGMASSARFDARQGRPQINPDLQDVVHTVHREFDEQLDPQAVDECLARVAAQFDEATVRSFVPLLVRRYVSDELHERLEHA